MRIVLTIVWLVTLAMVVAACGGDGTAAEPVQIEGPAMLMFYTDG